jgi:hypothetical protein
MLSCARTAGRRHAPSKSLNLKSITGGEGVKGLWGVRLPLTSRTRLMQLVAGIGFVRRERLRKSESFALALKRGHLLASGLLLRGRFALHWGVWLAPTLART